MAATAASTADLTIEDGDSNLRWFYPVSEAGYRPLQQPPNSHARALTRRRASARES